MNKFKLITIVQWILGILAFGFYGGIEHAEGWEVLFNTFMALLLMAAIWLFQNVKEVMEDEEYETRFNTDRKISKVSTRRRRTNA